MNTPTISALVLPFLVGILVGTAQPSSATEPLVGVCSNAPATNMVVDMVKSPVVMKGLLLNSRSSSNRLSSAMSPETAVMRSLRWFQETQNPDGSWSTDNDPKAVGTALAVLAFLSHGETPASTEFGDAVRKGLEYLVSVQQENGTFRETGTHRAIAHGIITLTLCEAFGMTNVPMLRDAAEKALETILGAQRSSGLWDAQYRPDGGDDDLEVSVWQVRAIWSGRMMGSKMDGLTGALKAAADGVTVVAATPDTSSAPFAIQPLIILHRNRDPVYLASLAILKDLRMDWDKPTFSDPVVRWYFTGQALFRHGGEAWSGWNRSKVPDLVRNQTVEKATDGIEIGYWGSPGEGEKYGRIYSTSLCSLMLQVYYPWSMRPVFQPKESIEDAEDVDIEINIE